MNVITSMIIALSMYSRIPMIRIKWTKERMKYSLAFFPLVGIIIGALEILWFVIFKRLMFNNIFYGAIATVVPVIVTGGIHMDGFLDTVDALSSMQPKEKKLEILKDSNSGAFAVIWAAVYFIVYFGAMTMADSYKTIFSIGIGYIISRALSGIAAIYFKNANKNGSLAAFSTAAVKKTVSIILLIVFILCCILLMKIDILQGVIIIITAVLMFIYYYFKSMKEFGGITGDLAGWFTAKCELLIVLVSVLYNYVCAL